MTDAFYMTADAVDSVCFLYNCNQGNENFTELNNYFAGVFRRTSGVGYMNGMSEISRDYVDCSGTRSVDTIDGEKILRFHLNRTPGTYVENNTEDFIYYRSWDRFSYFIKENSRAAIEINETDLTFKYFSNADTSMINNITRN